MGLSANDAFAAGGNSRRRRRGRSRGSLSEINVTPLVDVMLVLLIIFMISAPLLTAGVPVELPKTEAGAMQDQPKPLTLSIKADGSTLPRRGPGGVRPAGRAAARRGRVRAHPADLCARRRAGELFGGGPGDGLALHLRLHLDQPDHRHRRPLLRRAAPRDA
jgi:hypothetical protein